ncbi:MAG TPA: porin [Trinickia sp.]|jgi:predicted porin|uniref:porin n=1 Tax=Trinickia sp. TaxID=2571163 RepID=UPI002C6F34CE|nr:porin [Trinickia sp.]HTI16435.1 porin [Trinickia sp.]
MKSRTWKIGLPTLLLSAGAVHAQTSVTLYGLFDQGINYTNNANGGSAFQMKSGDTYGSRWGIKGREDLGDGYAAIFQVENGFNASNGALGQGGREFGRQAYIGVASSRLGTLTVGRQYDPTVDLFSGLTAGGNWGGDVGATPFDNDNTDLDFRIDNAVKYVTPTYAGFTGEAMYAFSNTAGGFSNNRLISGAGQYQNGGLRAAVAYMRIDNPGVGSSGAVTNDSIFTGSMQENIDAGVGYTFGKAMLAFAYSHTTVGDPTSNAYLSGSLTPVSGGAWTSWKFDNFQINGQYYFQPNLWLGASYTYTLGELDATTGSYSPKWHTVALELDYDLSKRTSLYVQGAWQHVQSANTGTQFDNAQIIAAAGPSSTENQIVSRVAMIHRF